MNSSRITIAVLFLSLTCLFASAQSAPGERPAGAKGGPPHGLAIGRYQRASLERLLAGPPEPVESLSVCVFRASFADTDIAAEHDSIYFANELRHVAEYYCGASMNRFRLRSVLVPGVVKLSHPEAYYGEDDLWKERMAEMLIELVARTDDRVDFSQYEAFAVIHADAGRETDFDDNSRTQVWSGFVSPDEMAEALKDTLGLPGVPTNDLVGGHVFSINNLMVWPEDASQDGRVFGSLGIYAYEMALRLGMIPLFDGTPSSFPNSQGVGMFDLTSYGLYNAIGFVPAFPSAFNRYLMGWVDAVTVEKDCNVRLADINSPSAGDTSLIKLPINSSEYYLVDNRVHDTNFNGRFDFIDLNGNGIPENEDTLRGAEFDFFLTETTDLREEDGRRLTGSGVMVWHVDESAIRAAIASGANPNDDASWKGVDLEEADHVQDLDSPGGYFAFGSYYDSFREGNNDRFAADTEPASLTNSGVPTGIELSDISEAAHVMSLKLRFVPPMSLARGEFAGNADGLNPIPGDVDGDGVEELVLAADTGLVYLVPQAGSPGWVGEAAAIVHADSALWAGSPILADIDGDHTSEIFITSRDGTLHAFEPTGAPYAIDVDATPGSLRLRGERCSEPIALEIDGDAEPEVLVLSSTEDSTYATIIGYSGSVPPFDDMRIVGLGAVEVRLWRGRLASHPALGVESYGGMGTRTGIVFAVWQYEGVLRFISAEFCNTGVCIIEPTRNVSNTIDLGEEIEKLLVPASGDIGKSGADELVVATPGGRLLYFSSGTFGVHSAGLRGRHPGAPVLADVDGDGTLETAIRDDNYLYLLSGYGTPMSGWPIRIDERLAAHDRTLQHAPPVIADVNGDGRLEVVFRVAGDLRAFDIQGRELSGWPLPGEGSRGGSPALLEGEGGDLYLFDAGTFLPYAVDSSLGGRARAASVSLRRYDPNTAYPLGQTWPCYRHDAGGSSRQAASLGESPREERIDPATFIVYPNPATGDHVTARVLISAPAAVTVKIYNVEGELVREAIQRHEWFAGSAVPFEATFSTNAISSGVYLCRLEVSGSGWSWSGAKKFSITR
jgi:M6 family metalloprotease-like protein